MILKEGGKIFKKKINRETDRIPNSEIDDVLKNFSNFLEKHLKLKFKKHFDVFGSYGSKESYGDLDIAVEFKDYSIFRNLIISNFEKYGSDFKLIDFVETKGFKMISFLYNPRKDVYYQIDVKVVGDLETFLWFKGVLPKNVSKYRSDHKLLLLQGIARYIGIFYDETNRLVKKFSLSYEKGLSTKDLQLEPDKKLEDVGVVVYQNISELGGESKNIDKILSILFWDGVKKEDVISFEDAWKLFLDKRFKYKEIRPSVVKFVFKECSKLGLTIPKEIEEYIKINKIEI